MKLLHIADCHLGCWKNERLEELNLAAFEKALDLAIEKGVDAVLISGDLFDVPLPSLRIVIRAMEKMRAVVERGIKIYAVCGSHDVSLSNVGVINLLESAKILKNVDFRKSDNIQHFIDGELFVIGISGTRKMREAEEIKHLGAFLDGKEKILKDKKKILLVHSTIKELIKESRLTKELSAIESISMNELPKGFDYYALGHIHDNIYISVGKDGVGKNSYCAYPGPTFPCNFEELERLKHGSCFIVDLEKGKIEKYSLKLIEVENLHFNADNKAPYALTEEIIKEIEARDIENKIVTLRLEGMLKEGRTGQIEFDKIIALLESRKALTFLKNTSKLSSKEFEAEMDLEIESIEKIELDFLSKIKNSQVAIELVRLLDKEKLEGETNAAFEERLFRDLNAKKNQFIEKIV